MLQEPKYVNLTFNGFNHFGDNFSCGEAEYIYEQAALHCRKVAFGDTSNFDALNACNWVQRDPASGDHNIIAIGTAKTGLTGRAR